MLLRWTWSPAQRLDFRSTHTTIQRISSFEWAAKLLSSLSEIPRWSLFVSLYCYVFDWTSFRLDFRTTCWPCLISLAKRSNDAKTVGLLWSGCHRFYAYKQPPCSDWFEGKVVKSCFARQSWFKYTITDPWMFDEITETTRGWLGGCSNNRIWISSKRWRITKSRYVWCLFWVVVKLFGHVA